MNILSNMAVTGSYARRRARGDLVGEGETGGLLGDAVPEAMWRVVG